MESITLEWTGGENFKLRDTPPCDQMKAKRLMVLALARCMASTVMSLMVKMRLHITGFSLEVDGVLTEREPHGASVFTSFHQRLRVECTEEKEHERIMRAVDLAHTRYCSVSLMMEMIAPLSYELFINDRPIPQEILVEE